MLSNLFRRKPKVDDTITGLNDYWTSENLKIPNKKVQKVIALKQKIKEIETEIKRIEEQKTSEDEIMFKPVPGASGGLKNKFSSLLILLYNSAWFEANGMVFPKR